MFALIIILVAFASLLGLGFGTANAQPTMNDLAIKWWQWNMPLMGTQSPTLDKTGIMTMKYQPSNTGIYFLGGEHKAIAPDRQITISQNRPLVFPVLVSFYISYVPTTADHAASEVQDYATNEVFKTASATVDGNPIPLQNIRTSLFGLHVPVGNFIDLAGSGDGTAMTTGYWAYVNALSPGIHVVKWYGAYGDYFDGVTYHIKVV